MFFNDFELPLASIWVPRGSLFGTVFSTLFLNVKIAQNGTPPHMGNLRQGRGGSGVLGIRRAVLAQLLGVLGDMYNYLYKFLLKKPATLVTSLEGCTKPAFAETS